MPVYQALVHVRGLIILDEHGNKREGGVYVWRSVEADDENTSLALAREALLNDPHFTDELWNESLDDLVFEADEIQENEQGEVEDSGFIFYIEEDEED